MEANVQPAQRAVSERRLVRRYTVDEPATLFLLRQGASYRGRLAELSLDGCRLHLDKDFNGGSELRAEVGFRIRGIAFRLLGTVVWAAERRTVGFGFGAMSERRRNDLADVLEELAAQRDEPAVPVPEPEAQKPEAWERPAQARPAQASPAQGSPARAAAPGTSQTISGRIAGEEKPPLPESRSRGDRREQLRHAVDSTAVIFLVDLRSRVQGRILDVSLSGCRICADERFPVGIYRRIEVEFTLDGLPFRLPGVVQSLHDRFTIGIRFLDLSVRKLEQLTMLTDELAAMRACEPQ